MFKIVNGRTGRETPCLGPQASFFFGPESNSPQSTTSPSREPRFIVGAFERKTDDEPSYGQESRHTPFESGFRIELTHIREKDLLSPPLLNRRWSDSSEAPICEFREVVQEYDARSGVPEWPGILRFVFRFLILLESIAVLATATHSVSIYTRFLWLHFPESNPARPPEVNLFPTSFFQVVAGVSLVSSAITWSLALRRRYTGTTTVGDPLVMALSGLMAGLWVAAMAISRQYESPDEPGLAWYACHHTVRPQREIANHRLVCAEQVSSPSGCCTLEVLDLIRL